MHRRTFLLLPIPLGLGLLGGELMEDAQANNLVTLVLPTGHTTGQRIVLDGNTGFIDIYDASNILRVELGPPDGIRLFTGDASELTGGHLKAIVLGAGGTRRLAAFLDAPQFSGLNFSTILAKSQSFDGTVPAGIELATDQLDLTGIALTAPPIVWAVDTNLYRAAANILKTDDTFNAVVDVQQNGVSLPRGFPVAPTVITANVAPAVATEQDVMTITWDAIASRRYRLQCHSRGATSTVAGNIRASITDNSNNHLAECDLQVTSANVVPNEVELSTHVKGVSGTVTYKVRMVTLTGGGNWTFAGTPEAYLSVEDVGAI